MVPTKLTASTETLKLRADSCTDFEIMAILPGESKTHFHYCFANLIIQSLMENRLYELLHPEMVSFYKW